MDIIDKATIECDGITYSVMLVPDYDASPDDADSYSASDKAAFAAGEWSYVGVIVRPVIDGNELREAEDSLWGVEYGFMPAETEPHEGGQHEDITIGMDYITGTHPVPDMISEVRANLRHMRDNLVPNAVTKANRLHELNLDDDDD